MLRRLRGRKSPVRVLLLTARDTLADRVQGLDLGADDYLTKPFDLPELEARVRALLRRGSANPAPYLRHGRLSLDTVGRRVFHDNAPVELSARELAVLELLMMREGWVVSKELMVSHLYGWGDEVGANAIEVYEPEHQLIDLVDQRPHLSRDVPHVDRAQVEVRPVRHRAREAGQRTQAARDAHVDGERGHDDQDQLRNHDTGQDVPGQARSPGRSCSM